MGVSGCGKSALARALATDLGWAFIEGDELHPPGNVAKMAAGIAPTDADRAPFLDNVAAALLAGPNAVAACSALKRAYRDRIRAQAGDVLFVLPAVRREELEQRVTSRGGHFMPVSLLESQLATLEPPGADEWAVTLDGHLPVAQLVAAVRAELSD